MATLFPDINIRLALEAWYEGKMKPEMWPRFTSSQDTGWATIGDAIVQWRDGVNAQPSEAELIIAWDSISADVTAVEELDTAQQLTRSDVKLVLMKELSKSSPNQGSAKTKIDTIISADTRLNNALTNVAALYDYDTATNTGYLRAALMLVALMN